MDSRETADACIAFLAEALRRAGYVGEVAYVSPDGYPSDWRTVGIPMVMDALCKLGFRIRVTDTSGALSPRGDIVRASMPTH